MKKYYLLLISFLCFSSIDLLIKIPTRERPEKFFQVLDMYYKKLSGKISYNFLINCDLNDLSMNNVQVKDKFKTYKNLTVIYGKNKNKIDAYNADMDKAPDFNIVMATSDDMIPVVKNYDLIIVSFFKENISDYDGVMKIRVLEKEDPVLNTLPIIGKKYYDRFGYIYYPDYRGFYCDLEYTIISRTLKKEFFLDRLLIRHDNPALLKVKPDKLFKKNLRFINVDRSLFFRRFNNGFDNKFAKEDLEWAAPYTKE